MTSHHTRCHSFPNASAVLHVQCRIVSLTSAPTAMRLCIHSAAAYLLQPTRADMPDVATEGRSTRVTTFAGPFVDAGLTMTARAPTQVLRRFNTGVKVGNIDAPASVRMSKWKVAV
jgi:hypothetical protein